MLATITIKPNEIQNMVQELTLNRDVVIVMTCSQLEMLRQTQKIPNHSAAVYRVSD